MSFVLLAYVRSWITGHPFLAEVAPITGPMYQLFIFFMITDPKTTVQTTWGQCVVAFLVALVEMMLRLHESVYAPLYALFLVGPSREPDRNLVERTAVCHRFRTIVLPENLNLLKSLTFSFFARILH